MPKRQRIELDEIADLNNLAAAVWLACKGKRARRGVQRFLQSFDANLSQLRKDILTQRIRFDEFTAFRIRDPKPRTIHAPSLRMRIVHHAILRLCGPHLERVFIEDSFACMPDRGPLAAVQRVQHFCRRAKWYLKVDIQQYFHSIDHEILLAQLSTRFKGHEFLLLLARIVEGFQSELSSDARHCGLPIGALTSQYFANFYLTIADRWLQRQPECRGPVRYMDDSVCWFETQDAAKQTLRRLTIFLRDELRLTVGRRTELNRCHHGITFCGHRIFPGIIRLSPRRERLYRRQCRHWEYKFQCGEIDEFKLQQAYASAWSLVKHADTRQWLRKRREQLHLVDET